MHGYQRIVSSNPEIDFVDQLAQNEASVNYDLPLPSRDPAWYLKAINIIAVQALNYEVWLFSRKLNMLGTLETDYFIGMWLFNAPTANQAGWPVTIVGSSPADPFTRYYIDSLDVPYLDMDTMLSSVSNPANPVRNANLHVRLINRSGTQKNADEAGALQVNFFFENQGIQP